MEGPLSKWTNVMKGWQYRWFVLDDSAGLLSYYTSKEKMVRGARRGCVRLKGAIVGIDDDDDSTFTITVDAKTFHFQAHDSDEREKWIRALEDTILRHAPVVRQRWDPSRPAATMADFDRKLTESDAYLQLLIDQANSLERHIISTEDPEEKKKCQDILAKVNDILESVKHSIVLLQIAKNTVFPVNGIYQPCNLVSEPPSSDSSSSVEPLPSVDSSSLGLAHAVQTGIEVGRECAEGTSLPLSAPVNARSIIDSALIPVPPMSYSSSDDEDFFDADEFVSSPAVSGPRLFEDAVETIENSNDLNRTKHEGSLSAEPTSEQNEIKSIAWHPSGGRKSDIFTDSDYDAMYEEEDNEDLGSMESHGSIIQHLISQVKIGMDLTKVVLPTFILERRSLLEIIVDFQDPKDRIVQVLKWYLSAFHAGRKSEVAKKPYNPIIGELFRCYWNLPSSNSTDNTPVVDGPVPWSTTNQLSFVAEQVSHHPPISAFYAEHYSKKISFCGHIWTKSKFLGLSICVQNIGQGCVSLIDVDEEYIINFPAGYGRSILTVPWIELGGTCQINCSKTGYSATIEFLTKPFYGGKKHKICAEVFSPGEKKSFLTVEGEWNGVMVANYPDGRIEPFIDTITSSLSSKSVKPIAEQKSNESRYLWREVTAGLKFNRIEQATEAKFSLEQKQRDEAKHRKQNNIPWETKLFTLSEENWIYNNPLQKRLSMTAKS